ncbi:hypothetical protein SDRG_11599 [Saprolegnia diclina VS20]|uniref:Uncharacterized protein n=1 Tax=Saprolegnia diclina (strain VS20) TaxID=1156394 RepID=T0QBC7_SAPDV|nr:hypothetical protein SDRG_11599 [Saprolegnia diclina VS20]EQC30840.1 hypothetical protein SDRG_11599 [Saprolegnia diclina VS20]|eukprot:XP_008615864.1 hypothetical protein SDRG_11599 [Saprolegnia diclina VS20]
MRKLAKWLRTSRVLKKLHLHGAFGVTLDALGSILPQLVQRRLESFSFDAHWETKHSMPPVNKTDAELLAYALKCRRHHECPLKIRIFIDSLDALAVLFPVLATCANVKLDVKWPDELDAEANALAAQHRLRIVRRHLFGGAFAPPV